MSSQKYNAPSLKGLFTAVKNMILPTVEAGLPLIRHPELGSAEDEALWRSEFDYLKNLAANIYDELLDGAFLWEMPIPVWSDQLWDDLNGEVA